MGKFRKSKINHEKFIELFYKKQWTIKKISIYFECREDSVTKYRRRNKLPARGRTFHGMLGKKHTAESRKKISDNLKGKFAKEKNPNWNGGQFIRSGYNIIRVEDDHPYAHKGYMKKARYVMEQQLGRYLDTKEYVHHINGNKQDDRIENLKLTNMVDHAKTHFPKGSKFGINSTPRK